MLLVANALFFSFFFRFVGDLRHSNKVYLTVSSDVPA